MRISRGSTIAARLCATLVAVGLLAVPALPGGPAEAAAGGRFVTTWDGDDWARLCLWGDVDVSIDWGDGTTEDVSGTRTPSHGWVEHAFAGIAPTRQVTVTGTFEQFGCPGDWSPNPVRGLISVDEWGDTGTTDISGAFDNTHQLTSVAEPPGTVTNMSGLFEDSSFNQPIGSWDTSNVTDMSEMFFDSGFNQPIGSWDTSHVTDMHWMFYDSSFDQRIRRWDTSQVTDMSLMFARSPFNHAIGAWDTSSVTQMRSMFFEAKRFNRNLSEWCVGLINHEPVSFDEGAISWTRARPLWGTCDGIDVAGPVATIHDLQQIGDLTVVNGNASDYSGVAQVLCTVQDRATGSWLRGNGTWGAYARLEADVTSPGAKDVTWRFGRRLPAGRYTLKVIGVDVLGNETPPPRAFTVFEVP